MYRPVTGRKKQTLQHTGDPFYESSAV